jgi:hypothetical protein
VTEETFDGVTPFVEMAVEVARLCSMGRWGMIACAARLVIESIKACES